jgi:hypothetical protein
VGQEGQENPDFERENRGLLDIWTLAPNSIQHRAKRLDPNELGGSNMSKSRKVVVTFTESELCAIDAYVQSWMEEVENYLANQASEGEVRDLKLQISALRKIHEA